MPAHSGFKSSYLFVRTFHLQNNSLPQPNSFRSQCLRLSVLVYFRVTIAQWSLEHQCDIGPVTAADACCCCCWWWSDWIRAAVLLLLALLTHYGARGFIIVHLHSHDLSWPNAGPSQSDTDSDYDPGHSQLVSKWKFPETLNPSLLFFSFFGYCLIRIVGSENKTCQVNTYIQRNIRSQSNK